MSELSVSFIIPHKGRELFLRKTLESIAMQDSAVAKDVIVVTQNGSLSEETLAFSQRLRLQVIYADQGLTISALRNLGVRDSDKSHLAFLDADIGLSRNWLDELLAQLEDDPSIVISSAMQVAGEDAPPLEHIRTTLSNASIDSPVDFLPGRNLLLRRETFETVGGFPEHLVTCEDYYFTDKVGELGTLWYTSRASYVHLGEDKRLDEMFDKEIWRGQSNLRSFQGRRIKLNEWPSFIIPPWISVLPILALLALLLGARMTALCLIAAAALPFGAYVTRLYFLAQGNIAITHIVGFYSYYFPARAWGTLLGGFRTLGQKLHDH